MSDTPNNAALLAELSALTAEVRAIRAEQAALTARSSAFTAIQTGEAVLPSSWTSTITTLRPEWMRSTTSDRLAVCRSVSS